VCKPDTENLLKQTNALFVTTARPACPNCGTPLVEGALGGLCRKCLARLGFGFSPASDSLAPEPGSVFGRFGDYELLEEIARGGMGVVYKARQLSLNRIVAVKMILHGPFSSKETIERFHTEAKAAAGLHHPNIVPIYEVGKQDGQHYFSMEFIEGQNLADAVRRGPMPARKAARYVQGMADAMQYAHEHGVLHRDLKPSNVLLDIFDQPRITDFGLAKIAANNSELTLTGQTLGSPGHMPPEQASGNRAATQQGDVYSLGAILYHLLTARAPFQGETIQEVLLQARTAEPVPPRRLNPSVPADLQTIALKCLQKDSAHRYESAGALAEDLRRFLNNQPILARPVSPVQKTRLWCRRHPVPALLSAALFVVVVIGVAGILAQWRRAERHAIGETANRRKAELYADRFQLNLYAADINLAAQAIQRGDFGLARRTLKSFEPAPGTKDLRGFEWRLLWNLCRGEQLATLTGHDWIVTCAAFSPDARLLATGSQDGTTKIWDVAGSKLIRSLSIGYGAIWSLAFSGDGQLLMSATTKGTTLWGTNDWQPVRTFPGILGALSTTGAVLATAESSPFNWEPAGKVTLWNYRTGEKLKELRKPGRALALSPDEHLLAVAGPKKDIELWDVATGELKQELPSEEVIWCVNFSPDGSKLAASGWNEKVSVWNMEQGKARLPARQLKGHTRTVWASVFSTDGSRFFTASSDQTIRSWDAATLEPRDVFRGHDSEVWCLALSANGKMLASGGKDQTVRLWPASLPPRCDTVPNDWITRPHFSPDSTRLQTVENNNENWRSQLWDANSRRALSDITGATVLGFATNGVQLVHLNEAARTLEIHGIEQAPIIVPLAGISEEEKPFWRVGLSADAQIFFALGQSGVARLWDTASGQLRVSFPCPKPPLRSVALSPNSRFLAVTVEREDIVHLYDIATGKELQLSGHRDFVSGVSFSPDGQTLATGSMDGTIRLWEIATGKQISVLSGHMEEVTDVAYSPDGRTLASVARRDALRLWHVATLRELLSIDLPHAGMFVQFSPDGTHLAVSTEDNGVRFFDAPAGERVQH
jgi:WD40 repeat protein/tRNA A-37 threonylcarbamoyl transferase component Bud32